jgi:NadR type nicotinamide-nucleotide adenylyltransferase
LLNTKHIIKIAVVGPESTGKSALCKQLAKHYKTNFVAEYARHYLEKTSGYYTEQDIITICQEQIKEEIIAEKKANAILFCDTSSIVCKVWLAEKFRKQDTFIEQNFKTYHYDLFLLCDTDLPWQYDILRENEHDRERLFTIYQDLLSINNKPYRIIRGQGIERRDTAIEIINNFFPILEKEL